MVDTRLLKGEVEDEVRKQLKNRYGIEFSSKKLLLVTGGKHEFDAVSEDQQVVASIKSASGLTSGGKLPSGKINSCIAELYYLSLVTAPTRFLVLTNPEFHQIFTRMMKRRLAEGLSIKLVKLSPEIAERVRQIQVRASKEVSPVIRTD